MSVKVTRPMLYILLSCALTLSQISPTMVKPREEAACLIWLPVNDVISPLTPLVAITSGKPLETADDTSESDEGSLLLFVLLTHDGAQLFIFIGSGG